MLGPVDLAPRMWTGGGGREELKMISEGQMVIQRGKNNGGKWIVM
jgi:hypothetical protein